jgi:uncharacterized membrane protein
LSDRWSSPQFPEPFQPTDAHLRSVNELFDEGRTLGQRAADSVTAFVGSWRFIIAQSILMTAWVVLNTTAIIQHWDPYPFIFMNLVFSLESALASPMILMSQNRETERDRFIAHNDYLLTVKAEAEIRAVLKHLAAQDKAIAQIHAMLLAIKAGEGEGQAAPPRDG